MSPIRIRRLVAELRMRRRRLDVYRPSPPWPGKEPARRFQLIRYDRALVAAAEMVDVPAPELTNGPLEPEVRAALEDRLAVAGVDVFGPIEGTGGLPYDEDA